MNNFVGIVFDSEEKAYEALHALWDLDHIGDITVHGTAVVHRDQSGELRVRSKETHPAFGTAVGLGLGALLGAFGPAVAMGATGHRADTDRIVGGAADVSRSQTFRQAVREGRFAMRRGQYAVIADVTEDWSTTIDTRMHKLGGTVYRRARRDVENDVGSMITMLATICIHMSMASVRRRTERLTLVRRSDSPLSLSRDCSRRKVEQGMTEHGASPCSVRDPLSLNALHPIEQLAVSAILTRDLIRTSSRCQASFSQIAVSAEISGITLPKTRDSRRLRSSASREANLRTLI